MRSTESCASTPKRCSVGPEWTRSSHHAPRDGSECSIEQVHRPKAVPEVAITLRVMGPNGLSGFIIRFEPREGQPRRRRRRGQTEIRLSLKFTALGVTSCWNSCSRNQACKRRARAGLTRDGSLLAAYQIW